MSHPLIDEGVKKLQAAIDHLHQEYGKVQTGRANASLVENLMVESYGSQLPIKSLANIAIPEARQITIQPWDRSQIATIEKAIRVSNLGLNPVNDGILIRLILPPLTEERRKELVKVVHRMAEEARITVRNIRHETLKEFKTFGKEWSEDDVKGKEKELQDHVDAFNKKIEEAAEKKEKDVMTV